MKSAESDALPGIPNVQKPNMLLRARAALRRWLHGLAPNATVEDFRTIALIYLVTTALLWALAYGAMSVFPENRKVPNAWHISPVQIWDVWFRWDSGNYHNIAYRGYQTGQKGLTEAPVERLGTLVIRLGASPEMTASAAQPRIVRVNGCDDRLRSRS